MKQLYIKALNSILTLLVLQTFFIFNTVTGQTIYKGDSVQLSITNAFRGSVKWQESLNGTTWTDISGGTVNNMLLKPIVNTQYRAVVTEQLCDPIYSAVKSIIISADTGITINSPVISSFNAVSATVKGEIIRLGGDAKVIEKGMCWSKVNNPTINDSKTSDGTGIGIFNSNISGLTENTTYFIRSYSKTDGGVILYSKETTLRTLPLVTISAVDVSKITTVAASSGGIITINGTETIIARGVCWNISQNPTIANSKSTDGIGAGTYSSSLTNLISEKIYYLRSYATTSSGMTYYGSQITFETLPTYVFSLQTASVTAITATTVTTGGSVSMTGTGTVAARGVCWSTVELPTIADNKTNNGTGIGNFSSSITGLVSSTTYYVRAYATSASGKTTYGNQSVFTTNAAFTITTTLVSAITAGTAVSGGKIVLNDAGAIINNIGVCWGTNPSPTINDEFTEDVNTAGSFSSTLFDLKPNTKYYIRAYVTNNSGKTIYGNELSFTTLFPLIISVTTTNPTSITVVSAITGGTITTTGPGSVTARGICYSSSPSPTIENNKIVSGIGTGIFTSLCNGLSGGELIYLRAFATSNSGTTTYGQEVSFTTLKALEVSTAAVVAVTADTATAGGTILLRSGTASRGVCWSTAHYPTILDDKIASGTGAGTFTSAIEGLTPETTYYVRAYATDAAGMTIYGEETAFTSLPLISITTSVPYDITDTGATVGGILSVNTNNTTGLNIAAGICVANTPYPLVITNLPNYGIITYKAGVFGDKIQNFMPAFQLVYGVKYYVRAYTFDAKGKIIYGNQETFTLTLTKGFDIKTIPISGISTTSAISGGNLTVGSEETSTSRGICWGTTYNPTILNNKIVSGNGSGTWNTTMTGLLPGTLYHVRAYVVNERGIAEYGKNEIFSTLGQALTESGITVLTAPLNYLTNTSASGGGTITNTGSEIIQSRGVTVFFNTGYIEKYSTGTTGSFTLDLSFPYVKTVYSVRAFVKTVSGKTIYGNVVTYDQDRYVSAFYTQQFGIRTFPKATSAVVSLLPYSIPPGVSYGFVYGTSENPTILNNKVVVDGMGTSSFLLKDLKPTTVYYLRTYIIYEGMVMYYNPTTFFTLDSDAFMVTTNIGGGNVGYQYMGGRVDVWEPTTIVSRGVCYSLDPKPTIASAKVLDGSGPGDFNVKLELMNEGSYYYCRAFATSSDGYTGYGAEKKILALAYVAPPPPIISDPGTIDQGNTGGGGTNPVPGPKYFIFARALGSAKNCNEGSFYFDDVKGIAKWKISGVFDSKSYAKQKIEMDTYIRAQFPGNREYQVENSYDFCQTAKYVVIIQYTLKISGWDCYSNLITAGYGNTANEALNHAVLRKNNSTIGNGKNATYKVIETINL